MLGSGFVNSVARPDGNTTGVNILGREGDGKRQDILIEALPGLRRIAALADVTTDPPLDALLEAARAHNIELSIYRIARGEEIVAAIDRAGSSGATALNVLSSALFWGNRQLIRDRVAALHLPAIYPFPEEAEEGGFAAYGPRLDDLFLEVMPQQRPIQLLIPRANRNHSLLTPTVERRASSYFSSGQPLWPLAAAARRWSSSTAHRRRVASIGRRSVIPQVR